MKSWNDQVRRDYVLVSATVSAIVGGLLGWLLTGGLGLPLAVVSIVVALCALAAGALGALRGEEFWKGLVRKLRDSLLWWW